MLLLLALHLQHTTPLSSPSLALHSFTPRLGTAHHQESSQTHATVTKESVLLSPSKMISHRSCFPGPELCGQSSANSTSSWGAHSAELDAGLQARCSSSGTTSWTPSLINEEQDQDNHSNAVLGGTASWDHVGSRNRFMAQLTKEVWVYLELKSAWISAYHSLGGMFLVLETILKRVWILCTFAFCVIKQFLVSYPVSEELCIHCFAWLIRCQDVCALPAYHPMAGSSAFTNVERKKKAIIGKRIIFMCTCLKTYFSIQ